MEDYVTTAAYSFGLMRLFVEDTRIQIVYSFSLSPLGFVSEVCKFRCRCGADALGEVDEASVYSFEDLFVGWCVFDR